jgi:hypothetical protein
MYTLKLVAVAGTLVAGGVTITVPWALKITVCSALASDSPVEFDHVVRT